MKKSKNEIKLAKALRAAGAGRWGVGPVRARASSFTSERDRSRSRAATRRAEREAHP